MNALCKYVQQKKKEVSLQSCVLWKRCSENMQQIYRKTPIPSVISFHASAWVFSCKFAANFQNIFLYEHLWRAAFEQILYKAHSQTSQISKMEIFAKIVNGFQLDLRFLTGLGAALTSLLITLSMFSTILNTLTLLWRRFLSYKNQSIDLLCKKWTGFYMIGTSVMKQLTYNIILI